MREKLLILIILSILSGCIYIPPTQIGVQRTSLQSPDPQVWRPDPTRAIFQNYSLNIYVQVWVGKLPSGNPDLELAPQEGRAFNFRSTGAQTLYLSGRERTASGWKNLGMRDRLVFVYPGSDVWELAIGDGDFYDFVIFPYPTERYWWHH